MIIREYSEQLYPDQSENLDKTDKFHNWMLKK